MTDQVGVAVVGAGKIARNWHLPEWDRRADGRTLWVVDLHEESARSSAERWAVPRWTTELTDALDDPDVDVVDVCTLPEAHVEIANAALAAGKHVLIEKPAATTLAGVAAMAAAAERMGAPVAMVAENWIHSAAVTTAQQLIVDGGVGDVESVVIALENRLALRNPPDRWRSLLLNAGVHAVNVVRYLLGEPTHVSAFTVPDQAAALTGPRTDTVVAATMRFADDQVASLHVSGRAHRPNPGTRQFRVLGSKGMIEFDVIQGWVLLTEGSGGPSHRWETPSVGLTEEIDHFLAAIHGQVEPRPSVRDQVRTHQVLDAIWRSARELTTVEVPGT